MISKEGKELVMATGRGEGGTGSRRWQAGLTSPGKVQGRFPERRVHKLCSGRKHLLLTWKEGMMLWSSVGGASCKSGGCPVSWEE